MHAVYEIIKKWNHDAEPILSGLFPKIEAIAKNGSNGSGAWKEFITGLAAWIVVLDEISCELSDGKWKTLPVSRLKEINHVLYGELKNYERSFANPRFAVEKLGDRYGQLAAYGATQFRRCIVFHFEDKAYKLAEMYQLLIDINDAFNAGVPDYDALKKLITRSVTSLSPEKTAAELFDRFSQDHTFLKDLIDSSDLSNDRYLYMYGDHITEHELKVAAFLRAYPEAKLEKLASTIVDAYIRGFENARKNYRKKKTAFLYTFAGYELLTRRIMALLREKGLEPLFNGVTSTACNRQYAYDHRFDEALYLDNEFMEKRIATYLKANELCSNFLADYSGAVYVETFGEEPFAPESKKENLVLSKEQQQIRQQLNGKLGEIREKFMPRTEGSFNITAFPSPEIGDRFEEIFADTCEINMLDTIEYEKMQQCMIDELDKAEYVEIKGVAGNRTDLRVAMQKLADPSKQTNFVNCGADVNVPVGEVFTSPQLKGTTGTLHVPETFLDGLKYSDLEIMFTDGWVTGYNCGNFADDGENKNYIEENLLFPHKTLPLGEFAIGTNTLAYVIAQKYGIIEKMPVLIVEKMGPHFAIGDTCFSHEEDFVVYNPIDNKEITARDNDKSLLRKTDMQQAYTFVHTDITLPYEGIGAITSVHADGTRVDIIKNGRFALKGTEELNKPLDNKR